MSKRRRDLILHKPERAIADDHGCTLGRVRILGVDGPGRTTGLGRSLPKQTHRTRVMPWPTLRLEPGRNFWCWWPTFLTFSVALTNGS